MTKSLFVSTFAALLAASLSAAPAKAPVYEPVAEGYCAWSGLTEGNRIYGRRLCPSDLRHKLTVVVYASADDFDKQVVDIANGIGSLNPSQSLFTPDATAVSRDKIALVVLVGKVDPQQVKKSISSHSEDLRTAVFFIYTNVKGSKVPDHGGKLPFYCAFGPEPGDPIASGDYNDDAIKKLASIRRDKKYVAGTWRPFYGSVEEPQFMKNYAKTLASGKPLDGLTASCRKGIGSKNPDQAKECQILYDALEQTRSDMLYSVQMYASTCPTRAFYEAQILLKKWPKTKKILQPAIDRIKGLPDVPQLCKMYTQLKTWGADDFHCKNAGEAKKYENELKKMKAHCDMLIQKSSVPIVQSVAAQIGSEAELLAPLMASKVLTK